MTYRENQGIREEIDRYLKKNAARQANLGVSSTKEERLAADRAWETDLLEIEKLDSEFAKAVHAESD
tara:strand:- start:1141 stop:1341 length:201 start_codon:yes stop_codon:yes gene_type:complete